MQLEIKIKIESSFDKFKLQALMNLIKEGWVIDKFNIKEQGISKFADILLIKKYEEK